MVAMAGVFLSIGGMFAGEYSAIRHRKSLMILITNTLQEMVKNRLRNASIYAIMPMPTTAQQRKGFFMSEDYDIITTPSQVTSTSLEMATRAEIDTQIATAKKYPRSIKQFMDTAMQMVTLNEEVATSCNYGLPRGGKIIEGPSARFAELIFSAWGNARAGGRIVHEDSRFVTSQGICHDLQSNTMITYEVKRRVTNKHGKTFDDDMIGVTGNAAASIALRNAILKVIPKAFWQPLYAEARRVSMGDSETLATRRAKALVIMQKFGVNLEMILAKFELKGVEDISLEHLALLKACAVSIRDGEATAESLFPTEKQADDAAAPKKGNDAVKAVLKKEKAAATGSNPETGEAAPKANPEEKAPPADESKADDSIPFAETASPAAVASTGLIRMPMVKGNSSAVDFTGWGELFVAGVKACKTLADVSALYAANAKTLAQIKGRHPVVFYKCEDAYNEAVDELKASAEE